jgi:hypothetical protein
MGSISPSTSTVYDLCFTALRKTGIIGLGDVVPANVMDEAMLELNSIRAEWSLNVKNYKNFNETFVLTAPQINITLGTSSSVTGDIPTRPNTITQVTVIAGTNPGANIVYALPILPMEEYFKLPLTNVFALPNAAYVDTSYPIQNIWFYPGLLPNWSVRVQGMSYMTDYTSVADDFMDPPEWFAPLVNATALRLATNYGVDIDSGVYAQLKSGLKHIEAHMLQARMKNMENGLKTGTAGGFNFYAGR